jgi:hypothetical protein
MYLVTRHGGQIGNWTYWVHINFNYKELALLLIHATIHYSSSSAYVIIGW